MANGRVLIGEEDIEQAKLSDKEKERFLVMVTELKKQRQRPQSTPPPKGSISLREAERKYGVDHASLSRWVKKGLIPICLRTKNWLYISEKRLVEVINNYKHNPGKGKRTLL